MQTLPPRHHAGARPRRFKGEGGQEPILLGLNGDVFDVSSGARFYGPEAPYRLFAGVDATRSLSTGSLEEGDLNSVDLTDFGSKPGAWDTLVEQWGFYADKYGRVGRLVEEDGSPAQYLVPPGQRMQGPLAGDVVEGFKAMSAPTPTPPPGSIMPGQPPVAPRAEPAQGDAAPTLPPAP